MAPMTPIHQLLEQAGLSIHQASVYESLVTLGPLPASKLAINAKVPRTLTYAVLSQLEDIGLVTKHEPKGTVATFSAAHPFRLQEITEQRKKSADTALTSIKNALPDLISSYNLASGKPGVQFFEGRDGVREALFDSLSSKEAIYTYADMETVDGYAGDINEEYVRARLRRKVQKRLLMPDTPAARAEVRKGDDELTMLRLLNDQDAPPFHTAIEIYDNKVSYLTFTKDSMTATIIHNPAIYQVHRFLFEHQWKQALSQKDVAPGGK